MRGLGKSLRVAAVARVVLAQAGEAVDDAAVGEDDFEAEDEIACHAVVHGIQAAGVGRQVAADLAAAGRAERKGKVAFGCRRRRLHVGEETAGLDGHGEIRRVHRANARQAAQREHDFVAARVRSGAAAVTCVAAVRHDRDAEFVADGEDGRDVGSRVRGGDQGRGAAVEPAEVDQVRFDVVGRLDAAGRTE